MKRRAITIIELLAAMVIMTVVMLILGQLRVVVSGQLRASQRRRTAMLEVANVMEHAMSTAWEQLNQDSTSTWQLSQDARQILPDATLTASVIDQDDTMPAKRVVLELSWSEARGEQNAVQSPFDAVDHRDP